jgi:hypothetical protein
MIMAITGTYTFDTKYECDFTIPWNYQGIPRTYEELYVCMCAYARLLHRSLQLLNQLTDFHET